MSRAARRCVICLSGLMLWVAAVPGAVRAQPAPQQEAKPEQAAAADPVLDAIGQHMSGESPAAAPDAPGGEGAFPSFGRLVVRLVVAMVFTLGALYGGLLALRRLLGQKGRIASPHVRVISRSCLSPKSSIYLVEVAGQTLVIGESGGGLSLLTTVTDPKALAPAAVEKMDDKALLSPRRAEKVAAALAGFGEQLGLTRWRLNTQSLSEKLRDGSRVARALSRRVGWRADEPTLGNIDSTRRD